jgi:acyl-CoA synthetase (AMP-forming)/AMP-acid ligase II
MRVDGENLAAAPIERVLQRLEAVNRVAVYAVPDENVGDQVMAAIVLQDDATLAPEELEAFLAAQADLSAKAWPRFVRIAITTRAARPACSGCGGGVHAHDVDEVELADLPCFGRRTRLVWSKRRWRCPTTSCPVITFTVTDERIAAPAAAITDRTTCPNCLYIPTGR